MLRHAARRCAQVRRPLRASIPTFSKVHTSAGPSKAQNAQRDVFLGTVAAAVGFGVWRYALKTEEKVHLDAEKAAKRGVGKLRSHELESSPSPSAENASFAPEASSSTSSTMSAPETVQSTEHEVDASPNSIDGPDSRSREPTEGDEDSEASNAGAFNPVTGEINWDCPCLGGMAHGPCGPDFREAFSCFVYSEDEPKGINCVEKFRAMQDCFRAHPEVYGDEIMRDDEEDEGLEPASSVPDEEPAPGATSVPSPSLQLR